MSLIENTKEIASLIKKIGDIELYRKIVELEAEIIELSREKHELSREVDNLRTKMKKKEEVRFESPYYLRTGDPVPFCARCWENDEKLIHVRPYVGGDGARYTNCRVCNTTERDGS